MKTKYKHLFFDLDNTLWSFDKNSKETLRELFVGYNLDLYFSSFEEFYVSYKKKNEELWVLYGGGKIDKQFLNVERFEAIFREAGLPILSQAATMADDYLQLVKTKTHLMPFTLHVLDYLREKGYQMHIISNGFSEVQYFKINNSGLKPYFASIYLSETVKKHKPDKLFFDYAIKSSNARKTESLVIGDNWQADIFGGRNAGIDQAFYNISNEKEMPFAPTYEITSLEELKLIL